MRKTVDYAAILLLCKRQPKDYEKLPAETKLRALEFEARQRSLAELGYERDEYMESLLTMQAEQPHIFKVLSPALRIAVGRYGQVKSKCAAEKRAA